MAEDRTEDESVARNAAQFATTHWSVVLAAGDSESPYSQEALEKLCRQYWFPLYAFVRRKGYSPEDSQDLTQGFFASILRRHALKQADVNRGRFRTFLLGALQNHIRMENRAQAAQKRGGGAQVVSWDLMNAEECYRGLQVDHLTPDRVFERRWAMALFESVIGQLRREFLESNRIDVFDRLRAYLWVQTDEAPYDEVARDLGLSQGATRMAVHRLRLRYRQLLRAEVGQTVADPSEIDEEIQYLIRVIGE